MAKLVCPDDESKAHILFADGRKSIPILTSGTAERIMLAALKRGLMTMEEAVSLYPQIEASSLPKTNWLGEIIQNIELYRQNIVREGPDVRWGE